MKLTIRSIPVAISLLTTGLLFASTANAITQPATVGDFIATPSQTLQTKATSWSDPAFGDAGWTHNSSWGKFTATAGQVVSIKAVSANPTIHPGISVWYRSDKDTIADTYVADHFYPQNANLFVKGAKDETTSEALGDLVMKIVKFGFDKDKNKGKLDATPGAAKRDGVAGQLVLTFTAKQTGTYMFVLGGFNPGPKVLTTDELALKYDVVTSVTITTP
jgi:hypothetical protein